MINKYKYKNPGISFPTNSISQMRIPIFLPVEQVRNHDRLKKWEYSSQFGSVTVGNCRLTQNHRNIIDIIFSNYQVVGELNDGSLEFAFTLYDLQKCLKKKSLKNHHWIKDKLDELVEATLIVKPTNNFFKEVEFSILNKHAKHQQLCGKTGKKLYSVVFNEKYINIFHIETSVYTGLLTRQIIDLKVPGAQALARYCLSHKNINMRLSKLLAVVGSSTDFLPASTVSRVKRRVLECKEQLEECFGISFNADIDKYNEKDPLVKYSKHNKIWFKNPKKKRMTK